MQKSKIDVKDFWQFLALRTDSWAEEEYQSSEKTLMYLITVLIEV